MEPMAADPRDDDLSLAADPRLTETRPADPKIVILLQYLRDLSFEVPHAPEILKHAARVPQGVVSIDIKATRLPTDEGQNYESVLKMRVEARLEDKIAYIVELHYAAIVHFDRVPEDETEPSLMIKVPRLMFPFARQIVAQTVQAGGFRSMLVNPIDFRLHYIEQLKARGVRRQGLIDSGPSDDD
jgi:preprotein translocase subunit SecB